MSELVRTSQVIAAEIRSIDAQTREIVLRSAIEIGKRLIEAKALVAHGEWGQWLTEHVEYSQSTANNFMRVAEEYKDSQALGNLSYSQAVALLGVPAEERKQFAAEVGAENLSTRELQQAIKEKKEAEKQAKKLEAELKKIQQAAEKERKEREALEKHVAELQDKLFDAEISGDEDAIQKLQREVDEAQAKVKQLEAELKAKPIDVPAVVERIPEEIERELADLRKMAAQPGNETLAKFKVQFEGLGASFRDLLATLAKVKTSDPETHEKYKRAVLGLLEKMSKTLEG